MEVPSLDSIILIHFQVPSSWHTVATAHWGQRFELPDPGQRHLETKLAESGREVVVSLST